MTNVEVTNVTDIDEEFDRLIEEIRSTHTVESTESTEAPTPTPESSVASLMSALESHEETPFTYTGPHIELNKVAATLDDTKTRFSGAVWFDKMSTIPVAVIGCGGIGSWTALLLARSGVSRVSLYDGDTVESVNMAGQLFKASNVGQNKARAVTDIILDFTVNTPVTCTQSNFSADNGLERITIGALDNMDARKLVYTSWKNRYGSDPKALLVDGRLSADELQVFAIKGGDTKAMKEYEEKWLFPQSEGEPTLCSFKQTSYMAAMIGGFITNLVVNHVTNLVNPDLMYDLPFFTSYNSEMMWLKSVQS